MNITRLVLSADSTQIRTANKDVKTLERSGVSAQNVMKRLASNMLAIGAAAVSVRQIAAYTDQWTDLNSRLLNAVGNHEEAENAMRSLMETARVTYSSLDQTAEAFLKNSSTLKELGYTTQQQIDLTDALNNGLVISGAKGQVAETVMGALSRSFAGGSLRGQNFNSVLERGDRVVRALADGLGVGVLQLRKMAEAGELTTTKVISALTSQMEILREEAERMPATISDGFVLMGNSALALVGRMDEAIGASSALSDMMVTTADAVSALTADADDLEDMIDKVTKTVEFAATVVGVRLVAALTASAAAKAKDIISSTAKSQADYRAAQAANALAQADLAAARAAAARTPGFYLNAQAVEALRIAEQRAIVATNALTAAKYKALTATNALRAGMGLIGGPVGAVALATGVMYSFRNELGLVSPSVDDLREKIERLSDGFDELTQKQAASRLITLQDEFNKITREAERLSRKIDGIANGLLPAMMEGAESSDLQRQLTHLAADLEGVEEQANKAAQAMATLQQISSGTYVRPEREQPVGPIAAVDEAALKKAAEEAKKAENALWEEKIWAASQGAREYAAAQEFAETTFSNARLKQLREAQQEEEDAQNKQKILNTQAQSIVDSLMTEEKAIQASYERRKKIILASTIGTQEELLEIEQRLNDQRRQQIADLENKRIAQTMSNYANLFDGLAGMSKAHAGEQSTAYRALFAVSKAFSVAQAVMSIATGIGKAQELGYPMNLIEMARVAATGATVLSQIQASSFEGGGFTGFGSRSGGVDGRGGFPAVLHPNETVIDHTKGGGMQQQPNNIRVINVMDPSVVGDYLDTDEGEEIIMNVVRRNQGGA